MGHLDLWQYEIAEGLVHFHDFTAIGTFRALGLLLQKQPNFSKYKPLGTFH